MNALRNNTFSNWFSLVFLFVNLSCVFVIAKIENYSLWFLGLLSINLLLSVIFAKKINKTVLVISRMLLGLLFIYSGFVKGVDPLGTQYRIIDYFYAYDTVWAIPFALYLSVILCATEFALGAFLLLNIKPKIVSFLSLLMMLFFTVTTLYDALYSPVPDCGCFGDALIISNWQTFYKNLVINVFMLIVFIRRTDFKVYKSKFVEFASILLIAVGFISFEFYNINNLPVVDFRSWKIGNRLLPENPQPIQHFLTYKHIETGEEKEFLSKEIPWRDTTFINNWKWFSTREVDPNIEDVNVFPMVDVDGNDFSKILVADTNYSFYFIIYNLEKLPIQTIEQIKDFYNIATEKGYNVVVLTNETYEFFEKFKNENGIEDINMYNSDDTALKAAIRSNPGLVIVKEGIVINKYHHRNFPSFEQFIKEYNID